MSTEAAATARRLLRGLDRGTLATALAGWPYASLVLVATAPDGAPLLLISRLAQHTINIAADPRVSLLLDGTAGLDEQLTGPRVTLLGRVEPSSDTMSRARFLARHPAAELYAGFADFGFYRIVVERAHLVAGFGRIEWIAAADLLPSGLGALAAAERDIVTRLNATESAAIALCARVLLGYEGAGWQATGIDPEGIDLRLGGRIGRLDFAAPAVTEEAALAAFAGLAARAKETGAA